MDWLPCPQPLDFGQSGFALLESFESSTWGGACTRGFGQAAGLRSLCCALADPVSRVISAMNQFLVHALPGSVLVVDISDVGPNTRTVPSHLFDSWKEAERHFLTRTIRHALEQLSAKGSVTKAGDEFVVEAEREGASARD